MSVDPSVIAAIEAAVEGDPANVALRAHLAGLRLRAGDPAGALEDARVALLGAPDDTSALAVARDAASLTGDDAQAESYGRLLAALQGQPPAEPRREQRSQPVEPVEPAEREQVRRLRAGGPDDVEDDGLDDLDDDAIRALGLAAGAEKITLADVAGMAAVRERLELAFLGPLRNPELRALYGKSLRGGLLLYGPPGCGKTFLARAIAGELGAAFFAIGLTDVLDMWLGQSEQRLHAIFEAARRRAPCVVFLDEVDALGQKRSHLRHSAGRNVVNQLLAELDGANAGNDGVFVLAATNHPWDVDTALRRPGRLDRTVLVLPPDEPARAAILERGLRERPTEGTDAGRIAARTSGFSGADLVHLVDVAVEHALADSIRSGSARPVTQKDLDRARKELSASTRPWFATAHNYALYANQDGTYDDLLAYIREHKLL
ncbi:MAG TPA: AAA family ATPase [Solirubrobacteraceae bacterium]